MRRQASSGGRSTAANRAAEASRARRHVEISSRRGLPSALNHNITRLRQSLIQGTPYGNFVVNGNPYSQASLRSLANTITALEGSPAFRNQAGTTLARSVQRRIYERLQNQAEHINAGIGQLQRQIVNLQQRVATASASRPQVNTRQQLNARFARIHALMSGLSESAANRILSRPYRSRALNTPPRARLPASRQAARNLRRGRRT